MLHTAQLTLDHARARDAFERSGSPPSGPGARASARQQAHAVARRGASPIGASPETIAKARALARVEQELLAFIASKPVGAQFQAADFNNHLHRLGAAPHESVMDPRAVGGLYRRLQDKGLLRPCGARFTGAGQFTNYNGSMRVVWEVARAPLPTDAVLSGSAP